jgi:hypothetical protein
MDFEDAEKLVCRIEVTDYGCIVFGRVADNPRKWLPEMLKMIDRVGPDVTSHKTPSERAIYHPLGSFTKHGNYRYHHHVHSPYGLKNTLKLIHRWLPKDFNIQ